MGEVRALDMKKALLSREKMTGSPSARGRATKVSKVGRACPIREYQTRTATLNSMRCLRGSQWRTKGRGFEFRSSRHARDLGQVLHLQLPVAHRRINSDTVSIAVVTREPLSIVDLKRRYRNIRNE